MRIKKISENPLLEKADIKTGQGGEKCSMSGIPILKGQKCMCFSNADSNQIFSKGAALRMIEEAQYKLESMKEDLLFDGDPLNLPF